MQRKILTDISTNFFEGIFQKAKNYPFVSFKTNNLNREEKKILQRQVLTNISINFNYEIKKKELVD